MAVYHLGPILRAVTRLRDKNERGKELGGAGVHLAVHIVVLTLLILTASDSL